jgi:hypothetical protein
MIDIGSSLLSNTINLGFANNIGNEISEYFVKKELKNPDAFRKQIAIGWIFNEMKGCEKGFEMDLGGKEGKLKMTVMKVE